MLEWRATRTWTFATATSGFAAQAPSSGASCDYNAATNTYTANAQMRADWSGLFNTAVANAAVHPISYEEGATLGLPLGSLVGLNSNGIENVWVIRDIGQIAFQGNEAVGPLYKNTPVTAVRLLLTDMPGSPPGNLHVFWQTNTSYQQVDFTNFNAAGTQQLPNPASRTPGANGQVVSTYNLPPRLLIRPAVVPKGKAFQPHYWAQVWVRFQGDEPPTASGFPPAGPFSGGCGWSAKRYELSQQLIIKEKLPKLKAE
jgi:hypothetical protein